MNEAKLYENESEKKLDENYDNNNNEYIKERVLNYDDTSSNSRTLFENKNDKLLNQIEVNNIINEPSNNNNKNLILNEENINNAENYKKNNSYHYGNIGKNIVMCNKYVLGIKSTFFLFIFTFGGMVLTFAGWVLTNNSFYPIYIYIIGGIPFLLSQIFFILCFFVEPGIIPRNDPNYLEGKENIENNKDLKKEGINNIGFESNPNENDKDNKNNNNDKNYIMGKDITQEKEINSKNDDQKIPIVIPKIFTERKCETCGIIRPPTASHCRYCDNCVLNFDHHCFYISNCVGKRNHKYFYLFLFFGSISAIIGCLFNSIVLLYIFIINPEGIWTLMFSNDKWLMILCLSLIGFSTIYALLGCINIFVLYGPSGIGLLLFTYLFFKNMPKTFEPYRNPFVIIDILGSSHFGVFVIITFFRQTKSIGSGLTLKQNNSIHKEIVDNSLKNQNVQFDKNYLSKKSLKEQFHNIVEFLKRKIDKSLIVPQRDLYKIE